MHSSTLQMPIELDRTSLVKKSFRGGAKLQQQREYVEPDVAPKKLRVGDRFFARNRQGKLAWFEVVALAEDGCEAATLGQSDSESHRFDSSVGSPEWVVEGIDVGPRFAPDESSLAFKHFESLSRSGAVFGLDAYLKAPGYRTNQIHLNGHPQAVACLGFGQYFLCSNEIWVVVQSTPKELLARKLVDETLCYFARSGEAKNQSGERITAAILAEAPYRASGWIHEIAKSVGRGIFSLRLFCLSPGSLNAAVIGSTLVLNSGLGLCAEKWIVNDRVGSDLHVTSGPKKGILNVTSGEGRLDANGRHFLAVIVSDEWVPSDLTPAFEQALRYA